MGTLSKRRLEDFGIDVLARVEEFRKSAAGKIDGLAHSTVVTEKLAPLGKKAPWWAIAAASLGVFVLAVYKLSGERGR